MSEAPSPNYWIRSTISSHLPEIWFHAFLPRLCGHLCSFMSIALSPFADSPYLRYRRYAKHLVGCAHIGSRLRRPTQRRWYLELQKLNICFWDDPSFRPSHHSWKKFSHLASSPLPPDGMVLLLWRGLGTLGYTMLLMYTLGTIHCGKHLVRHTGLTVTTAIVQSTSYHSQERWTRSWVSQFRVLTKHTQIYGIGTVFKGSHQFDICIGLDISRLYSYLVRV